MSTQDHIRRTIDLALAASAGEASWGDVTAALVTQAAAGTSVIWTTGALLRTVDVLSTSCSAADEALYASYYHQRDVWAKAFAARGAGSGDVSLGPEIVPERDLRASEVYNDFFRRVGMFHIVGTLTPLGGTAGWLAVTMHRPETSPAFDERDRQAVAAVLPALRRLLRVQHELRAATGAAQASLTALAAYATPALAVDRYGRILFANPLAAALLHARRGLTSQAGYCVTVADTDADALLALIRQAASGSGRLLRLQAKPGEAPITLLACRPADAGGGVVLLLMLDPAAQRQNATAMLLQTLHALTLAEAEVAEAAARGASAAAIAAARGTAEATVRSQLRAALEKMQAPNLRALTALVAALPDIAE
jgi:DNA-binding CsgD family transcriptional regulator